MPVARLPGTQSRPCPVGGSGRHVCHRVPWWRHYSISAVRCPARSRRVSGNRFPVGGSPVCGSRCFSPPWVVQWVGEHVHQLARTVAQALGSGTGGIDKGTAAGAKLHLKMCPEIVAMSPGCKERGEPKTGAYLDVCEDFRRDPRRRRLGPQQISGHVVSRIVARGDERCGAAIGAGGLAVRILGQDGCDSHRLAPMRLL